MVTAALCIGGRILPGVHCLSTGVQHRLSRMSVSFLPGGRGGPLWLLSWVKPLALGGWIQLFGIQGACPDHSGHPTVACFSSLQTGVGTHSVCHGELGQCHPCRGRLGSLSHKRAGGGTERSKAVPQHLGWDLCCEGGLGGPIHDSWSCIPQPSQV